MTTRKPALVCHRCTQPGTPSNPLSTDQESGYLFHDTCPGYNVRARGPAEGIPGRVFTDPSWMLHEVSISARKIRDGWYRISDIHGFRGTDITFSPEGRMLFNGFYVDTEDYMAFVGMLDAIDEGQTHFDGDI